MTNKNFSFPSVYDGSSTESENDDFFDDILSDEEYHEYKKRAFLVSTFAAVGAIKRMKVERDQAYVRSRIEWHAHVSSLLEEGPHTFARFYRMSYSSFNKLLKLLKPYLVVDKGMADVKSSKGPIIPEVCLHCLLRWLAGDSYLGIRVAAGISVPSFYRVVYKCIDVINQCPQLKYHLPTDLNEAAQNFEDISSHSAISGCIGVVDGYLLEIQTPATDETGNVKSYFSGHYHKYGVNIQAACDDKCRFISVCVAAPGGTNDLAAFRETSLSDWVHTLPIGKFMIGDNAYICSDQLLTPYHSDEIDDAKKDAYNFYVSQLQIRIEMAFGLMTQKRRILKQPLYVSLKNVGRVFLAITHLHNFCIDEGCTENYDEEESTSDTVVDWSDFSNVENLTYIRNNLVMRKYLVKYIFNLGLVRPTHY